MDSKLLEQLNTMGEGADLTTHRKLSSFLYGDFGVGKTTLAGQIIKAIGGNAILINTDSCWTVLQKDMELASKIKRYQFDSFKQIRLIVEAHNEGIEPYASAKTLLWDTASTSNDNMLRELCRLKKFPNQQIDPDVEGYPHYRMVANGLKQTVDMLKESDLHVIYTAHIKEPSKSDKEDKVIKRFAIRPNLPEASYNIIAQEANLLGWLYREKEEVKIQFNPTQQETAKSQIPTIEQKTYKAAEIPNLILKWLQQ